jgi:uncharacterized protein YjbK
MNKPLTSREYKLILNADRFKDRQQGTDNFGELIECLVKKIGGKLEKKAKEDKERQTYYLDTVGLDLYQLGLILRVREEKSDVSKITLKYRHYDRYLSASQDLSSVDKKGKYKFEEDILANGSSKFSHSVSIKKKKPWLVKNELKTMDNVIKLFPGLKDLDSCNEATMQIVNDFKAHEIVGKVGYIDFDNGQTEIKAELSFWYLLGKSDEFPLIVEFSCGYDALANGAVPNQLEQFPIEVVRKTHLLFKTLKKQVGWVSETAMTKTNYAYQVG